MGFSHFDVLLFTCFSLREYVCAALGSDVGQLRIWAELSRDHVSLEGRNQDLSLFRNTRRLRTLQLHLIA